MVGSIRFFFCCLLALFVAASAVSPVTAAPLLQEGKKTLFQRVVTHPGAKLYAGAEAGAAVLQESVKTFTCMYVYARQGNRIEVGTSSLKADGWMDAAATTYWPQAITMLFTDRMGRLPVLFFRDHTALEKTCQAASVRDTVRQYAQKVAGGTALPADFPVVASEPADASVSEKNFYLLPVLNIDRQYSSTAGVNLLEVASINPGISKQENKEAAPASADFRTGFAFVIDTTISMKPYIDQTIKLIRTLYDELEKSPHGDKMAFAVVAFRSNTERAPGIEYTSKVICDFKTVASRAELEAALANLQESTVSTHDFNEDAFAGVKEAADSLNWKDYGSRVMLLISDAGPLQAGDPTSKTGLSPEALADYLKSNKIFLSALHIKSPSGAKNHAYAEKNYRELAKQADNQVSYLSIDAQNAEQGAAAFDRIGHQLGTSYAQVVSATAEGKFIAKPAQANSQKKLTPEEEAARIAASTGYAMQLQFYGTQKNKTAPEVVKAWIADADLETLEEKNGAPVLAATPAVLLTKSQLSRLRQQLKVILKASEEAFLNGNSNIFDQLRSVAAGMSQDPNAFSVKPGQNLVESGALEEILADLPYSSPIVALRPEHWEGMSIGERDTFIRRLKGLIALYDEYDRDATHWESFGSRNPDDWVYRVPLSVLP